MPRLAGWRAGPPAPRTGRSEVSDPSSSGAVVDLDRRRLLFVGDELMVDMAERRAMMCALATVWPDYAIGWAYDGTAELAGYVGAELRNTANRG